MRTSLPLSCLTVLLLTACASGQLTKDQTVSATGNSGIIVLGMDLQSDFKSPLFIFRRYDPRTGKVDPDGVKSVSTSMEDLSGGQKFAAAMSGATSLPKGRQYFVFELPPGEWFLYCVTGYYNNGLGSAYSATSFLSKGTLAFESGAGVARYLGEYRVTGKFGDNLQLQTLDEDLTAAQSELKKYPHIEMPLQSSKPATATFSCEMKKIFMSSEETCQWKTVTVQVAGPPAASAN
jgi:hypothetical protein